MAEVIKGDCRRDIGGDEQRINSLDTRHGDVTFKHMLLPVWIGAYLYGGKTYQILINGASAEVQGDRPYSVMKIVLAVTAALLVIAAIVGVYVLSQR